VVTLTEHPHLLKAEIMRRVASRPAGRPSRLAPLTPQRGAARVEKSIDRLLHAYQESLLSLEAPLRKQQGAIRSELEALETATADQLLYLRLVESLA
jgi:site-specific DNA recombinase